MCDVTKNEQYEEKWNDYFSFVNTNVTKRMVFEDELYIAFGSYYNLPVEEIANWYADAEKELVSTVDARGYIAHKYADYNPTEDDIDEYLEDEISEGMVFENMGYWFRA